MSTQSLAHAAAEPVSEEDYQALLALLSATARGRAFLDEHARRARHADTGVLLAAVARIEAQLAAQPTRDEVFAELAALGESVRGVRSQIDAAQLTAAVTKLAATLDNVQQRLTTPAAEPVPAPTAVQQPEAKSAPEPKPVQPPFALALTAVAAQVLAAAEPDEEPVKVLKAGTIPPPPPFAGEDFASDDLQSDAPPAERDDPMRPIMALSEEERLALFT